MLLSYRLSRKTDIAVGLSFTYNSDYTGNPSPHCKIAFYATPL